MAPLCGPSFDIACVGRPDSRSAMLTSADHGQPTAPPGLSPRRMSPAATVPKVGAPLQLRPSRISVIHRIRKMTPPDVDIPQREQQARPTPGGLRAPLQTGSPGDASRCAPPWLVTPDPRARRSVDVRPHLMTDKKDYGISALRDSRRLR
jgi:hypothetical protein